MKITKLVIVYLRMEMPLTISNDTMNSIRIFLQEKINTEMDIKKIHGFDFGIKLQKLQAKKKKVFLTSCNARAR